MCRYPVKFPPIHALFFIVLLIVKFLKGCILFTGVYHTFVKFGVLFLTVVVLVWMIWNMAVAGLLYWSHRRHCCHPAWPPYQLVLVIQEYSGSWPSDVHANFYPHHGTGGGGLIDPPEFLICYSISKQFCLQWKAFDLLNKMRYKLFYGWRCCWRLVTSPTMVTILAATLDFTKN